MDSQQLPSASEQHAFNNCQILFDPDQKQPREKLCELIDSDIQPRAILFFFITNTCNIVEGLTEQQLTAVIHTIKSFTDEKVIDWGKFIFECFITPIDIVQSGQIYAIWSLLFLEAGVVKLPEQQTSEQHTSQLQSTEITTE